MRSGEGCSGPLSAGPRPAARLRPTLGLQKPGLAQALCRVLPTAEGSCEMEMREGPTHLQGQPLTSTWAWVDAAREEGHNWPYSPVSTAWPAVGPGTRGHLGLGVSDSRRAAGSSAILLPTEPEGQPLAVIFHGAWMF